ncbi:MlaA family lipoprotein [Sandarakinorhabdus sp. DWP1-3-1]|uniref:MlaA family lipoprotein n=1 Tax=Sandarakinorhabdus sp. DWP1-3-1 TaxID=2804627 RepID=UPI003CF41F7D
MFLRFRAPAAILPLLVLAACATPRAGGLETAEADRWEASNRRIYAFNKRVDKYALKPAANTYRTVVPIAARHGVTNVYSTYNEPLNFLNDLLQGKISKAFRSVDRFLINATIGVGGLADNATDLGRPEEPEDWGQTFAHWGIKSGPYVMLPFLGPSTLRDSFGLGFDFVVHPSDFVRNATLSPSLYWRAGQISVRLVNLRARITDQGGDALLADSLDEYTLVKSAYLQSRRNAIWDGNPPYDASEDGSEDVPPPADAPAPAPAPTAPTPPQ